MTPERGWQDVERAAGGASDHARDRLGAEMSSEVAATRAAWADALLRSDAALRQGRPDEARRALDDQRRLLVQLQQRLDRVVSSALVEREAEQAVRSGLSALDADQRPAPSHEAPAAAVSRPGLPSDASSGTATSSPGHRLPRTLAGAMAAVLVGLVATVAGGTTPPAPEIAAMEEPDATTPERVEVLDTDDGFDGSTAAPADELRGLGSWTPSEARATIDAPTDDPDDERRPTAAPSKDAQPSPDPTTSRTREEPEPDRTPTRDEGEDRPTAADEDAAADEGDEVGGLRDRLPSLDRPLTHRLGEQVEDLWQR